MPTGKPEKMKPCKICGEMFLPEKPSSKICNKTHYAKCPICGSQMIWNTTRSVEPCSKECRKELRKRLNIQKYGCEHPMQNKEVQAKHRQSMKEKYGVESPLQSSEIKSKVISTNQKKFGSDWALSNSDVKHKAESTMEKRYGAKTTLQSAILSDKVKRTNESRYGFDNAMKNEDIKNKAKKTNVERYGVDNVMKNSEISNKSKETRFQRYGVHWTEEMADKCKATWLDHLGVDNPSKCSEVIDKITETFLNKYGVKRAINVPEFRQKMIDTMIERYGVPYYCLTEEYRSSDHFRISKVNKSFGEMLESHGISYEMEFRIDSKSYDFHILGTNMLIEINPSYTHNVIGNHWNKNGLEEDYHLNKTKIAQEHGYRCIHIFDWDNIDSVLDMLTPKKSIYARKCTVYKLRNKVVDEFLNQYHLQGTCRGQLLCLGLVKDNEIYQVMTFGKSRYDKSHTVELLRLCTRSGYSVVGGASKLFSYATKEFGLSDIISYCDLSKFSGDVYSKIGMKHIRTSPPQEIWSREHDKVTANLLRQRGYDQLFNTNYGKGTNNEVLMLQNGWLPVYDCGQVVYEYK